MSRPSTECTIGHCPRDVCEKLCIEINKNNPITACEHTLINPNGAYGDECAAFRGAVPVVKKHDLGNASYPYLPTKQCAVLGKCFYIFVSK